MPSPEVHQKAKEKSGSAQHQITNCSSSLPFMPDDEFVELLWENGDIVMKSQSSRTKNCSLSSCFLFDSPKVQEKDGGDAVIPKIERYSSLSSVTNDFSLPGPSGQVGLVQDDEIAPWLNYPIHDSLQSDYFGEFLSELSGPIPNSLSRESNAVLTDSNGQARIDTTVASAFSSGSQEQRNSSEVVGGSEPNRIRSSQSCSAKQGQPLVSNLTPRISEFLNKDKGNNHQVVPRNLTQSPVSATGVTISTSIRPPEPGKSRGAVNFSHFLRPAALVKANLEGIGTASASFSNATRLKINEEVSASGSNIIEPSLVASTNSSKSLVGVKYLPISDPHKVDSKSHHKPPHELISVEKSESTCQEDASRTNNHNSSRDDAPSQSLSFAASVAAQTSESERASEPVFASSSICSGNSSGGLPSEPKHAAKRKAGELEELEYQSEDVEDESTDVKKPIKSTKRSRTSEVHNLSERRRRDRINEKMRALQELIPNCNKVDKASMLDEAIEYIKTLQLHMQIMSMGSRPCMPPMMLPAGIQHIGTPPMPYFSPLGVGLGMGMSAAFGMGIPEVNYMVPVPSIHGAQFPCPSVPGASNLHGMQVSTPHMFGVPGQHPPFTHPHPPFIPLSGGVSPKESSVPNVSGIATPVSNQDSSLPSCSKDQSQNINLQAMHNKNTDCSQIQASTEERKESSEPGDLVQKNNPTSPVNAAGS